MCDKIIRRKVKEEALQETLLTKLMAFDLVIFKFYSVLAVPTGKRLEIWWIGWCISDWKQRQGYSVEYDLCRPAISLVG